MLIDLSTHFLFTNRKATAVYTLLYKKESRIIDEYMKAGFIELKRENYSWYWEANDVMGEQYSGLLFLYANNPNI